MHRVRRAVVLGVVGQSALEDAADGLLNAHGRRQGRVEHVARDQGLKADQVVHAGLRDGREVLSAAATVVGDVERGHFATGFRVLAGALWEGVRRRGAFGSSMTSWTAVVSLVTAFTTCC